MTNAPLQNQQGSPTNQGSNTNTPNGSDGTLKPEMIEELVSKKVSQLEVERVQRQNLQTVQNELVKAFGNDYVTKLNETAESLGLDKQTLDNLAKTQPKAFFRLVGLDKPQAAAPQEPGLFTPPATRQTSSFAPQTNVRNQDFYSNLRKTDPKTYWQPATQNQMHIDAAKLGSTFYTK